MFTKTILRTAYRIDFDQASGKYINLYNKIKKIDGVTSVEFATFSQKAIYFTVKSEMDTKDFWDHFEAILHMEVL